MITPWTYPPSLPSLVRTHRIPHNSNPQFKMAYTHAKSTIRAVCDGALDVNANSKKEVELAIGVSSGEASDSDSEFDD